MTKRYEKYKDSGIAWIGEIPEHWEMCKIKHIILLLTDYDANGSFADIAANTNINNGNPYAWMVRATDLENKRYGIVEGNNYCDIETFRFLKKSFLKSNDILIAKRGEIGKVYMVPNCESPMTLAPNTYLLKTKINICNRYLFYYLKSDIGKELLKQNNKSTAIGALYKNDVKDMPCFLCDMPTQEQIAKYLDWKCGEVDRIVEVRERQIKLLGELRTSVISRAVTRGLNPNAPLKDSGIDWIGQIPKHWEVCRFKNFICLINTPSTCSNKIGLENIESGTAKFLATNSEFEGNGVEFTNGDIVYGKLRPYLKKVWLSNCSGNAVGDFFVFRVNGNAYNKYIQYLLLSDAFTSVADGATYGAKMPRVSGDFILNLRYYIPSVKEQQQIAEYLDKKTEEIDSTVNKFKVQIDKLKEYRQALITEVVTGKIDVRGIEIPTPKSN